MTRTDAPRGRHGGTARLALRSHATAVTRGRPACDGVPAGGREAHA